MPVPEQVGSMVDSVFKTGKSRSRWHFGDNSSFDQGFDEIRSLFNTLDEPLIRHAFAQNFEIGYPTGAFVRPVAARLLGLKANLYTIDQWTQAVQDNNPVYIPFHFPEYEYVLDALGKNSTIDPKTKRPIVEMSCIPDGGEIMLQSKELADLKKQLGRDSHILSRASHLQLQTTIVRVRYGPLIPLEKVIRHIDYLAVIGFFPNAGRPPYAIKPVVATRFWWDDEKKIRGGKTSKQIVEDYVDHELQSRATYYWSVAQAIMGAYPGGLVRPK